MAHGHSFPRLFGLIGIIHKRAVNVEGIQVQHVDFHMRFSSTFYVVYAFICGKK